MVEGGSSKEDCVPCKMGEYGDKEGATACKPCPPGSSSVVGSTRHSDCEPRVIVLPAKIAVELTPDSKPRRQSLTLVNTGVKPLRWFGEWANGAPGWVRLIDTGGEVVAGNLTTINLELSFLRNLANTSTWTEELIIAAGKKNSSVLVELSTRPGKFNPNASFLQDNSAGSVFVGETARYTVVTRDRYLQSRLESAAEGSLQLQVAPLLGGGAQSCTVNCTKDTSSCRECCCKDEEDGKYSVTFLTSKEGKYSIAVLALREGLSLGFKEGQDGILVVKEMLDRKTSCGNVDIQQHPGTGSNESRLIIQVSGAKADPKFTLSRADSDEPINGTAGGFNGKWTADYSLKTGRWKVEYRSGKEVCRTQVLARVACLTGYDEKQSKCVPDTYTGNRTIIMATVIRAVIVIMTFMNIIVKTS